MKQKHSPPEPRSTIDAQTQLNRQINNAEEAIVAAIRALVDLGLSLDRVGTAVKLAESQLFETLAAVQEKADRSLTTPKND